ncbi:peptidylprolyl isomerase [Pontivivens insulae]|uniref:Peptidyl-prolyl cis-trans isomerase n=1 Tax=Pontivivens insulae TaxID=1639689 RepID=A0A2R8ABY0_9RHOB|nr:peptidylprolyl isomerase [Pontivivens insulae]RED11118.1 peptidylprolyl isomerase [Pontivivens insulae]SPF29707.1 Peptidyl-prolyl cis-trans isomerase B [Pontivivens insulae]
MIRAALLATALVATPAVADELVLELETGNVVIDLFEDVAPGHVERITSLAADGAYDGVAFHRVIEGFMAQTGDVQCGVVGASCPAGTGGSDQPDLLAEFSAVSFERGVVGMARSQNPNSANSQFFIMFAPAPHLNGQYTVVGEVTEGMDLVDGITHGSGRSGSVANPDRIVSASAR